jgi:hypothetical protein
MRKPFTHLDRDSDIRCDNPHCAQVRGIEGVVRQPIKKNVIARAPEGQKKFYCYDCQQFEKTGLTRPQRKAAERKRRAEREEALELKRAKELAAKASK